MNEYKKTKINKTAKIAGAIIIGFCLLVAVGSMTEDQSNNAMPEATKSPVAKEQKLYSLISSKQIGTTKMYVIFTDPTYRNQDQLKLVAAQVFSDTSKAEDFIVKIFDNELAAGFFSDVPQTEWKKTAQQDDYAYVAMHQYGLLTYNKTANLQSIDFYPSGMNGQRIEL